MKKSRQSYELDYKRQIVGKVGTRPNLQMARATRSTSA